MTDLADAKQLPASLSVSLNMTDEIRTSLRQGEGYLDVASAYEIATHADAQLAVNERNDCLKAIDRLKELKKGFIAPAKQIIANAEALFDPAIDGYSQSVTLLNTRIREWQQKENARIAAETAAREEEQRRARQEAERIAAEQQARAQQIAAQKQREAEEAERERQAAEAAGNTQAAADAAAAKASATEAANAALEDGTAKAQEAHLQVAAVATASAPPPNQKLAGNSLRENYVAKLRPNLTENQAKALIVLAAVLPPNPDGSPHDLAKLARPELLAMLKLDLGALNKMSKALKGAFNVPGFEAVDEPIVAGSKKG